MWARTEEGRNGSEGEGTERKERKGEEEGARVESRETISTAVSNLPGGIISGGTMSIGPGPRSPCM